MHGNLGPHFLSHFLSHGGIPTTIQENAILYFISFTPSYPLLYAHITKSGDEFLCYGQDGRRGDAEVTCHCQRVLFVWLL